MTSFVATVIGLIGSALFVAGFAYANIVAVIDKRLFNGVNLIGSICLLISLSVDFNLPAFVLESIWGLIALAGLVAALRRTEVRP